MAAEPRSSDKGVRGVRWAWMQGFQVSKDDSPYLDRLRIVQTPWFGVYLHRIHRPDGDRDPHDHPWSFASLVLSGGYVEHVWDVEPPSIENNWEARSNFRKRHRSRGSLRSMGREQAHMIVETSGVLWTLVVVGPRRGGWSFWTTHGPVAWQDYIKAGEMTT